MCREYLRKLKFRPSGPRLDSRPEVYRERQLAAELMWRGKSRRAEEGSAAGWIRAGDNVDRFTVALRGRELEAKEV